MMRIKRIDSHGGDNANSDSLKYLMATEYYLGHDDEHHTTARWIGTGAATLGLDGSRVVTLEDMGKLASGFDPITGRSLSESAGKQAVWVAKKDKDGNPLLDKDGKELGYWRGGHRIGFDCTFSSPKSLSIVFARAEGEERERIVAAHRTAVERALGVMEQIIETRRGHAGAEVIPVKGLVASGHTHFSAREADGAIDMQLHEHVLVYGVAQGEDDAWKGWDAKELYANQRMLGALYRAELAKQVQALGYGITKRPEVDADGRTTGEVYWEVRGVSQEMCDHFSGRTKQIEAYKREHGGGHEEATLATRTEKDEPPFPELDAIWQTRLNAYCERVPGTFTHARELLGRESAVQMATDADILSTLHEHEAVWTKQDLAAQIAREQVGVLDIAGAMKEADAFVARNDLVEINPERKDPDRPSNGARRHTEPRYAARWWVEDLEEKMVHGAVARKDDKSMAVPQKTIDAAVAEFEKERGYTLLPEQRAAVEHLCGTGGVSILSGRAGTGKTTITDVVVRAFRADGREVIGCSAAWDAARKLESETGMESFSTARLLQDLDHGRRKLTDRSVVIMDEAGMAGTYDIARLSAHVHAAGCKFIPEGDDQQLQPVAAGGGFRLLADTLGDAKLTTNQRQHAEEDKALVEKHYDTNGERYRTRKAQQEQGAALLQMMESRGQIEHFDTKDEAINSLVTDYLASPSKVKDKIVMAGTRADVQRLNYAIRSGMQERGGVSKDEVFTDVVDGGTKRCIPLAVGDRIRFGKRDEELGLVNGSVGMVQAIHTRASGNVRLDVKLDGDLASERGRIVKIDTSTFDHFGYAYAGTVHRSQGQTKDEAFQLATAGMTDRHLSLVAASRARDRYKLYGAEGDLETLADRLGMDRLRVNALEEGRKDVAHPVSEITKGIEQAVKRRKQREKVGIGLDD